MLAIQLSYYQVSQTFVVLHKQNIYHFFLSFMLLTNMRFIDN